MKFDVLTLFPELIDRYVDTGVLGRARKNKMIAVTAHDLRDWTTDKHRTVDDTPYGGGAGMVMKIEPIYKALAAFKKKDKLAPSKRKVVLLSASGQTWNQAKAKEYSKLKSLTLICGRYEGIDERVSALIDEEISIGDYVLTGGEAGAMVIIDSVARLLPGVLGNEESLTFESHSIPGQLEYPQYTKPEAIRLGKKTYRVPPVLVSGNHGAIETWRSEHLGKKPSATPARQPRQGSSRPPKKSR